MARELTLICPGPESPRLSALLAAVRMAVWFLRLRSAAPLFTFTALFIPVSLMAGLLFLVMSALFRQAAELKEDQDLTI